MATYGEIVYAVLDLLKVHSDDSYFTEEHILFLAGKIRALLLERKYRNARNMAYSEMSDENTQQICLNLEPTSLLPNGCEGMWLRSIEEIPDTFSSYEPRLSAISDVLHSMVNYIPIERMPYVGYNKWLKNIIYAAKSADDHLYLTSNNPQFIYLKQVKMQGVFSDPEKAAELSCEGNGDDDGACDVMDKHFPLEDALVPSCIEMILQELIRPVYAPQDKYNDAHDGLSDISAVGSRAATPAERMKEQETKDAAKAASDAAKNRK